MELISAFFFIGLVTTVIGGISAKVVFSPIPQVDNIALIPTITAHRYDNLVVISHIRGYTINKCVIVLNGLKMSSWATGFKIGDTIELSCQNNSYIELYDSDKLLFFAII
jgi:hypothetical protein